MRYLLAAICICALGAPAASALPVAGSHALSISQADSIVQVAKKGAGKVSKRGGGKKGGGLGGIHPLVGSGDY